MIEIELRLSPQEAHNPEAIRRAAAQKIGINPSTINDVHVLRRSIDARSRDVVFQLRVAVYTEGSVYQPEPALLKNLKNVDNAPRVLVIGAGPAGYFAALELIELGFKPVVFDRGKDVRARRRDLRAIQQFGVVNPHSNYCFGEGGAGTYSDGKLYTRSHKRGSIEKTLKLLVEHGATSDILIDAHPHIGSNKLPQVVQNIRETIIHFGGEVHFDSFVTDFILRGQKIVGIVTNDKDEHFGEATILATGHSARDIYYLLHRKNIKIEAKPFALGVRIEHSQAFIDEVQYKKRERGDLLPAASYSLVCQVNGRGVFSFCMCPGGLVVPAATAPNEIVVNGMSMSRRDSPFANSGTVVAIEIEDLKGFEKHGVFAGLAFQQSVEQKMFTAGDGSQKAPAQRLTDFAHRKISANLPPTSYIPGLFSAPLHELLPPSVFHRLQNGVQQFGKMMRGYMTAEANVIGTESRTSAPVRIPRNGLTLMHDEVAGLFPSGEGAGYAGGIISAAMDGQNVAKAVAKWLFA
ncbi:MAG: FAD-binding protein [Saprospiraceae bacterium]|nr:FAD-binding protein [Saprospiraceae bacterium]